MIVFDWKSVYDLNFSHCYFGMNNQTRFKWIRILLCIVPLFVPSWAEIPYDEVKYKMFENDNVERIILKSLQTTKNVFAQQESKTAVLIGLGAALIIPPLGPIASMLFVIVNLLAEESDWREVFSRTIANQLERGIALSHVQLMKAKIETIDEKLDLLSERHPKIVRRNIARFIHRELDTMLNIFAGGNSFIKKYPLIGTPLLIALAQLAALFHPVAKRLVPREAKKPGLPCKMKYILLDYRPRMINARLEKLHGSSPEGLRLADHKKYLRSRLSRAMSFDYNRNGYNKTIPATLDCEKGCNSNWCLIDDFGDTYGVPPWSCPNDYALFLRHRVEQMFPVELLNDLCVNEPEATGTFDYIQFIN